MLMDEVRMARIVDAFWAKPSVVVVRPGKPAEGRTPAGPPRPIDVRALALAADVIGGEAAAKLCAALDWPAAAALARVRIRASSDGSAKPAEVAKALGVWGPEDLRAEHALVARLGCVAEEPDAVLAGPRLRLVEPGADLVASGTPS
jgi:hypothetical protein